MVWTAKTGVSTSNSFRYRFRERLMIFLVLNDMKIPNRTRSVRGVYRLATNQSLSW